MKSLLTRLAPTPSGFLHLGNVLSFALTAGLASRLDARILLRIDDLDSRRVRQPYIQDIFDTLNFLEIPWHEGPADPVEYKRKYSQARRMDLYRDALKQLGEKNNLFACACSRSDVLQKSNNGAYPGTCRNRTIPFESENVSWRLRTIPGKILQMNLSGNEIVQAELPVSMQEFVVRRKDGLPSYQLASLIDDLHFGVNLVIRGEDLWDSTLAQLYLADVLGQGSFGRSVFYHHQLLKDSRGRKISKSTGTGQAGAGMAAGSASLISVRHLRELGKKRAAVYTLIGSMLQLDEPVSDWQSLAAAAMRGKITRGAEQ